MKLLKERASSSIFLQKNQKSRPQHPLKLSIITQFYPPDYAPTGQLIEELATYLSLQEGMHVQIFTGQPGYAFQKDSAPSVEYLDRLLIQRSRIAQIWPQRIRGKAVNGLLFCLRSGLHLLKAHLLKASSHRDTLLLTTAPPYLPILGYLANLLFATPYVCIVYDLYPDVAVQLKVLPPRHRLAQIWDFINHLTWKRAKQVIVLSPTMKERIATKYPDISNKISVIHSWADPDVIVPIAKQENWFAYKYNLVKKFTVLYSGNMGRCHDMDTIFEAACHLQDEPIQFVFIGGGAKLRECKDKVKELSLGNCLFLPYQDKETLPYSLTACDLSFVSVSSGMDGLVLPSKFYGILAAGRPVAVVCEPNSYLREMVTEAKCGQTFANGDSKGLVEFIRLLSTDKNLARQLGEASRNYLESNFTPEIIAKQYSQILTANTLLMSPTTVS